MKFSIIHPSNWLVKEDEESPHETVSFELSDRTRSIFVIHISEVEPYLDTSTMTLKNTSLEQYVQQQQDVLSSLDINYNLVRQNEVTVGGNVGIKVEYTAGIFYTSQVYTIANGKLYSLLYADYPLKVPETLPLANKMVESFQIKR